MFILHSQGKGMDWKWRLQVRRRRGTTFLIVLTWMPPCRKFRQPRAAEVNAERRSLTVHMPVIALRQFRCDQGCAFILSAGNCNASNPLLSVEQDEAGGQSVEAG